MNLVSKTILTQEMRSNTFQLKLLFQFIDECITVIHKEEEK